MDSIKFGLWLMDSPNVNPTEEPLYRIEFGVSYYVSRTTGSRSAPYHRARFSLRPSSSGIYSFGFGLSR